MSFPFARGVALSAAAALFPFAGALAADLPPIKTSEQNKVPDCATPGRVMAYIKARNSNLDPRFEKIAVEYMRQGEELGVRWDYAIAQMAIETNYLSYRAAGGRRSDVAPSQNNFAGIGATGGVPGESFKDVATGVRAHLQHLLLYAGDDVEDAVAERTRKVKEWGVLRSFHAKIKGPVTFSDLARKWATSAEYGVAINTHAKIFYSDFCTKADPQPDLLAEVRGVTATQTAAVDAKKDKVVAGVDLARKAIEEGKAEGDDRRRGLGAARFAKPVEPQQQEAAEPPKRAVAQVPGMMVLNAPKPEVEPAKPQTAEKSEPAAKPEQVAVRPEKPAAAVGKAEKAPGAEKPAQFVAASAGGLAAKSLAPVAPGTKCRVWTASYGGQRAIIIRSQADGAVNYTVLDVNEGAEKREADAYISAYAKGGVVAETFGSQTQALDKAFELCPEG